MRDQGDPKLRDMTHEIVTSTLCMCTVFVSSEFKNRFSYATDARVE